MPPPSFARTGVLESFLQQNNKVRRPDMSAMESLLQASPEIGEALIELMFGV